MKKTSKPVAILALLLSAMASPVARAQSDYVVHEWGTFTSVQGGDGELMPWRPLQTSELPGFVYNWNRPGLNREHLNILNVSLSCIKGSMVTLQRMETPVVYFYSSRDMQADLSVAFPKGIVTEWYPQATQIGPSVPRDTNIWCDSTLPQSRAVWKHLHLIVPVTNSADAYVLPQDNSGSHYFAARETASDLVQMNFAGPANQISETDKFIFYRGAGSFKTPLHVSVAADGAIITKNTGADRLAHLFLLSVHDHGHGKTAAVTSLPAIASGHSQSCPFAQPTDFAPFEKFQSEISTQMQAALIDAGLFPAEAKAMVNTWKDSWFAEEGDRVLYILPRPWTDETLPMTLDPKPQNLVRVMVGRAEIITPKAALDLSGNLTRAAAGDVDGRQTALREIQAFGRFAEPALSLASKQNPSTNTLAMGYQLLSQSWLDAQAKSQ